MKKRSRPDRKRKTNSKVFFFYIELKIQRSNSTLAGNYEEKAERFSEAIFRLKVTFGSRALKTTIAGYIQNKKSFFINF